MIILKDVLSCLDIFLANFSVFIFGYSYLLRTKKEIDEEVEAKNEGALGYTVLENIDEPDNMEDVGKFHHPIINDRINSKINALYFRCGATLVTLATFITIFNKLGNFFISIIVFLIFVLISICIVSVLRKIENEMKK